MRTGLGKLVIKLTDNHGDRGTIAAAVVQFMDDTGKGFSPSAFGDRFQQEVHEGCIKSAKGKPARIQELARLLVCEPDHRGVSKMLRRLAHLRETDDAFGGIETDCHREFWDAIRIGAFETADAGLAEITHWRAHTRPKPPAKAISNIHKAKGLECPGRCEQGIHRENVRAYGHRRRCEAPLCPAARTRMVSKAAKQRLRSFKPRGNPS